MTKELFKIGDKFGKGKGYKITYCSEDAIEMTKPNGRKLSLALSIAYDLAALVREKRITLSDIQRADVLRKIPDLMLEPQILNGYNNILPFIVRKINSRTNGIDTVRGIDRVVEPVKLKRGSEPAQCQCVSRLDIIIVQFIAVYSAIDKIRFVKYDDRIFEKRHEHGGGPVSFYEVDFYQLQKEEGVHPL